MIRALFAAAMLLALAACQGGSDQPASGAPENRSGPGPAHTGARASDTAAEVRNAPPSGRIELRGSGVAATETRNVSAFERIELRGSTDVDVTVGQALKVTVTGDDNIVPHIRTQVQGDTLMIEMDDGTYSSKLKELVTLSVPNLSGVTIKGSGNVDARGVSGSKFIANSSGSGKLKVDGKAEELQASSTGSGDMELSNLATQRADVTLRGSASIHVAASDTLKANVIGSGEVRYKGSPKTEVSTVGSGRVKQD